jgi:hypothetical protein
MARGARLVDLPLNSAQEIKKPRCLAALATGPPAYIERWVVRLGQASYDEIADRGCPARLRSMA